jgi:hypothetical protein
MPEKVDIEVRGIVNIPKDATTTQIKFAIDEAHKAITTLVYDTLRKKGWKV